MTPTEETGEHAHPRAAYSTCSDAKAVSGSISGQGHIALFDYFREVFRIWLQRGRRARVYKAR